MTYILKAIKNWPGDLIVLLAGAMLTLAFSPYDFYLLAVISPAFLLPFCLSISHTRFFLRVFFKVLGLFSIYARFFKSMSGFYDLCAPF